MKLRSLRCLILGTTLFCCIAQAMQQSSPSSNSQNSDNKGLPEVPYFIDSNMIGPKREFIKENKDRVIIQQVRVLQQGRDATCGYHAFKNACLLAGIIQGRIDGRLLMDPSICNFFSAGPEIGEARAEVIRSRKISAFQERIWEEQLKVHDPQKKGDENANQLQASYNNALKAFIEHEIDEYDRTKNDKPITGKQICEVLANQLDHSQDKNPGFNELARKREVYERYVHITAKPISVSEYVNEQIKEEDDNNGTWLHSKEIEHIQDKHKELGISNLIDALGTVPIYYVDNFHKYNIHSIFGRHSVSTRLKPGIHAILINPAVHWVAMVVEIGNGCHRYTIANSSNELGMEAVFRMVEIVEKLHKRTLSQLNSLPPGEEPSKKSEISTSYTDISAIQIMSTSFEQILKKTIWLSPTQSQQLFNLTCRIEHILDKAECLHNLLSCNVKSEEDEVGKTVEELLKIEQIDTQKQKKFVNKLLKKNLCNTNDEIKPMLNNLVAVLNKLDALLNNLTDFQKSKESGALLQTLQKIIEPYGLIKNKLLSTIARSSLIIKNHFVIIQNAPTANDRSHAKPEKKGNGSSHKMTEQIDSPANDTDELAQSTSSTPKGKDSQSATMKSAPKTLHEAALLNDCKRIEGLIRAGHNINQLNDAGLAPLHIAIRAQNLNAIITLLENGADPNIYSDYSERTPLHYAVATDYANVDDQIRVVNELLARQADINTAACKRLYWFSRLIDLATGSLRRWETPLHLAVGTGNYKIAKLLIDRGADVKGLNRPPLNASSYSTPLSYAVTGGHSKIVDLLLEHGASDPSAASILTSAACSDHVAMVKSLLTHDYFCNAVPAALNFILCPFAGQSNTKERLEITQLLLDKMLVKKVNFDAFELAFTFSSDHQIAIAQLLAKYPLFDVNEVLSLILSRQSTGLSHCCKDNNRCIRLLLAKGADVRKLPQEAAKNYYCLRHLLHEAAEAGDAARVKALLANNPNLRNQKDESGNMPIHFAASNGNLPVVSALVNGIAMVDSGNNFGLLPLHCAALAGHTNIVAALLKYEKIKTINAKNIHGLTPLHAAIMAGKVDTARLLLDQGADASVQDERGLTPVHYASQLMRMQFDLQFAIRQLVQQHSADSPHEDHGFTIEDEMLDKENTKQKIKVTKSIKAVNIATSFCGLMINGQIIPSLQQARPDGQITNCCGYYALYNALSLLNPQKFPRLNRQNFNVFFEPALRALWQFRNYGSSDNLIANEIRHLVNILHPNEHIIVLDKNALYGAISGKITLEKAFDNDQKSVALWRQFMEGDRKELAIVAGIGVDAGHWITIHAKRDQANIFLQVTDSLCKVESWRHNDHICSYVAPFYFALTTQEDQWPEFFDESLNKKIFAEYQEQDLPSTELKNANLLCATLERFMESIKDINESLIALIQAGADQPFDRKLIFLTTIRLYDFYKISKGAIPVLLTGKAKLASMGDNPGTVALDALLKFLFEKSNVTLGNIQVLIEQQQTTDNDYQIIDTVISFLREALVHAQTVIDVLCTTDELLTNENLFDADLLPLDKDLVQSMVESAPQTIKDIIGHLKNKDVEQQIVRVLFVGHPGNGKTTLAQAIAQECNRPYRFIRASALGDSFQFSRERDLKRLMPFIQKHPNAVIIIDEIDAIKDRESEPNRTAEVLQSIIDMCNRRFPEVIFIGTTNDQKLVPAALFSRLAQSMVEITNPNDELRLKLINRYFCKLNEKKIANNLTSAQLEQLAHITGEFSVRQIEGMFRIAIIKATNLQYPKVAKPSLKAWLLRKKIAPSNIITFDTMNEALQIIRNSLPEEQRMSFLGKALNFAKQNRGEIGSVVCAATGLGMQGYQIYRQKQDRKEDLARQDDLDSERTWGDVGAATGGLIGGCVGGPAGIAVGISIGSSAGRLAYKGTRAAGYKNPWDMVKAAYMATKNGANEEAQVIYSQVPADGVVGIGARAAINHFLPKGCFDLPHNEYKCL